MERLDIHLAKKLDAPRAQVQKLIKAGAVTVNGKKVPMKGFVQDIIGQAIVGMVSTLKGVAKPKKVEVKILVG